MTDSTGFHTAPAYSAHASAAFQGGEVRQRVSQILDDFVEGKITAARTGALPEEVAEYVGDFLNAGGKRIRPLLCVLGWHAAGGAGGVDQAARVGAALEMFHAFCLIHDDVMDHSATRRGRPAMHRALAAHHSKDRTRQAATDIGTAAAILMGDLALIWSDELLHASETALDARQRTRVLPLIDTMRNEVLYGQYLDLTATSQPTPDVGLALRVIRYKTAKYTIERPLHIGAALAGAPDTLLAQLSSFAVPLGEAFQLRDDLLGVFGHPVETGKPALDDLREGKHTCLIALTLRNAPRAQADQLRLLVGCPTLTEDQAHIARSIITASGAPDTVEEMIRDRYARASSALAAAPVPADIRASLQDMAHQAVWRTT
ncbi:All-trans-nonaprenyl-diphosphate synthase (geranyl-diphosphate specific) [Streptomyces sp. ADI96-02]|uniref:polyprenyl synthetase family protein n=1 Tax=Streptomyces sp. ADI96-02 TaxID=1522760 RepID=UPI000FAD91ED|nr:polyprenyl synthetase family protein [Streptomyces sp. ADI96-02]RPK63577.1 All-trans-nonaprenyl-diphosphate synthase (geranyl-diphosphate specific) [Streptomyces sp. ADI96-02]